MRKDYVMGNSAIAAGALCSGVKLVAGYPGTPSTEIIESIFHAPHDGVHLEWSVNEKAAMEDLPKHLWQMADCRLCMVEI